MSPFAGASQEPIRLLESVTAVEMASCVPFVKITKVDPQGKPVTDQRPLMYDLIQGPTFDGSDRFGTDSDSLLERSLISLNAVNVQTVMPNGDILYRRVTLDFTVHRPDVIFDKESKVPWREILEEGNSFALEYGWRADPTICKNELFNGYGHVTQNGLVIKSTQSVLLTVYEWTVDLKENGEVDVTVNATENGDLALRESRFSDAFEDAFPLPVGPFKNVIKGNDNLNSARLKSLLDSLLKVQNIGRGELYKMGDILDNIVGPMITSAARTFGYCSDQGPVELLCGNFNTQAGMLSPAFGGKAMARASIADFMVPVGFLRDQLSKELSDGRALTLKNFIEHIIGIMNGQEGWGPSGEGLKPNVALKSSTINTPKGLRLVMMIYDRRTIADTVRRVTPLSLDRQSRREVLQALANADVPVLEFMRAGSYVKGAKFEMQPQPLFQAILVEKAAQARKDRVEAAKLPDIETRKGQAAAHDIIPISILTGDVTLVGNFVFDVLGQIWVEFFGSAAISGIFSVLEKSDRIEPGSFTSTLKLISEGLDPLNTRRRASNNGSGGPQADAVSGA